MHTTRLLETIRLGEDSAPISRGVLAGLMILLIAFAIGYSPRQPATIIIVATPTPNGSEAARELTFKIARRSSSAAPVNIGNAPDAAVLAAPAPTEAPAEGYTAQTDRGAVYVPDDATPVPTGEPYTGPFLAPVVESVPTEALRLCTGFRDWRDYDPMYASSPVCHQP